MEGCSVNINMNKVGVLTPPDKMPRLVLYSDKEASSNMNGARFDVYTTNKKISFEDRFSTPKSVFYALGIASLALIGPSVCKYIKKVFRK